MNQPRRDALIRVQRAQIDKLVDRYRAAWQSARARARQLRDDRDGTVWVHPQRQGGIACVGGTRVPVDNVVALLADGVPPEEIADCYPSVTAEGAEAAEAFAARYAERHVTPTGDALADQLAEHREAIEYALRHTLTSWADATGRAEGTAAGALHRALDWITGMTPVHDPATEAVALALEVEECRGATARVEARQDAMDRRLDQLARRLDDVETTVHRQPTCSSTLNSSTGPMVCELPHGHHGQHQGTTEWTPALERATTADIAAALTAGGIGETVARELASLLQQRFEIRQPTREDE